MKKALLLLSAVCALLTPAFAQFPYNVSVQSQTYQPLTGAASMNGSTAWDDESYMVPMPFSFKIGGIVTNKFSMILSATIAAADTQGLVNGFMLGDIDLADRGIAGTSSLSPVRYLSTGTAPNRIFKVEIANAGFYAELDAYGTMNDYLNLQVWYYETSNIAELHIGASQISHPSDYYVTGSGPLFGFAKNLSLDSGSFTAIYGLKGNPLSPVIDSVDINLPVAPVLNAYPANGTVYRFTPKTTTGVATAEQLTNIKVYPTDARQLLYIDCAEKEVTSYQIVSADGKTVAVNGRLHNGSNQIDINMLANGHYYLIARNVKGQGTYHFSKL